jgi:hypothetical protein
LCAAGVAALLKNQRQNASAERAAALVGALCGIFRLGYLAAVEVEGRQELRAACASTCICATGCRQSIRDVPIVVAVNGHVVGTFGITERISPLEGLTRASGISYVP